MDTRDALIEKVAAIPTNRPSTTGDKVVHNLLVPIGFGGAGAAMAIPSEDPAAIVGSAIANAIIGLALGQYKEHKIRKAYKNFSDLPGESRENIGASLDAAQKALGRSRIFGEIDSGYSS